jgi:glycosyltransferase involved in cell wall biosynthesis
MAIVLDGRAISPTERVQAVAIEPVRPLSTLPPVLATIVLPAYNEAAALPTVLSTLAAALDNRYEVIVVDDGSADDTAAIAASYPCRVLRHEQNRGKGAAVRTGIAAAQGRHIIIMDADNTYPVEAVPGMVDLLEQHPIVRGERQYDAQRMPLVNRIGNMLFDTLLNRVHGLEGSDHLSGLYGLRREVLDALCLRAERFDLEVEIGIKARALGLRSMSLPIPYGMRLGEKKLRAWHDGWYILRRSLVLGLRTNPVITFLFGHHGTL